jgi:hypothetical protein
MPKAWRRKTVKPIVGEDFVGKTFLRTITATALSVGVNRRRTLSKFDADSHHRAVEARIGEPVPEICTGR